MSFLGYLSFLILTMTENTSTNFLLSTFDVEQCLHSSHFMSVFLNHRKNIVASNFTTLRSRMIDLVTQLPLLCSFLTIFYPQQLVTMLWVCLLLFLVISVLDWREFDHKYFFEINLTHFTSFTHCNINQFTGTPAINSSQFQNQKPSFK